MKTTFRTLVFCAAAAGLLVAFAPRAAADVTYSSSGVAAGIGPMLGHVMGVEAASLASVPAARLQRLGAPFAPPRGRFGQGRGQGRGGADPRVMTASGLAALGPSRGNRQWRCLTEALYFEARGEDVAGQYAVAEVILNRVDHANYPGTICEVVNEGTGRRNACQFTYTCDGRPEDVHDTAAWNRLGHIARIMMDGAPRDLTDGATHYHATWVNPNWARVYPRTAQYGGHVFYRQQY